MEKTKLPSQTSEALAQQKIDSKQNKPLYTKVVLPVIFGISFFFCFHNFFVNYTDIGGGRWLIFHFSIVQVHFLFVNWILLYFFPFMIKYCQIMFSIIVFWLGSDRPSGIHFVLCPLWFFPYSRLSSYLLLFLCVI